MIAELRARGDRQQPLPAAPPPTIVAIPVGQHAAEIHQQFEPAEAHYREALRIRPSYPDAHLNLGLTLAEQGKPEEAAKALEAAIALDPKDPVPRHELAALLMDEGDHRAAIAHLREVVRLDPKNHEAQLDLGICYAQKGFYVEAERAYRRAGELAPGELLVHYDLAALYALWGRPDEALPELEKALGQDAAKVKGWLATDPMFDSLKGDPAFENLLER